MKTLGHVVSAKIYFLFFFPVVCLWELFVVIDQGLFSVPALVFDLAQLTSQKRFDGGYDIIEPSTTFLGTSYGQIVVAVFT